MINNSVELSQTYSALIHLLALSETVCPDWLRDGVQEMIDCCYARLPVRFEIEFPAVDD